jgi:hypothetical protein
MKRPTVNKAMIEEAAKLYASKASFATDDERDVLAHDIAEHYRYPFMDGFELGKALDGEGWEIDAEIVSDLDTFQYEVADILKAAERKWFEWEKPQPPFPVGTMIREGEITGIYEHGPAKYLVKKPGQDDATTGNRRLIINFEDAVLVSSPQAAAV